MIIIDVLGTPAPKGSSRAMIISGRAVNVPGGSNTNRTKLKSWDRNVRDSALEVLGELVDGPVYKLCPLTVLLEFRLTRPSGHWGAKGLKPSAPVAPATKPDIDKLARATIDSLIGLAFDDDSRIVRLAVTKLYAEPGREGARITVEEWKA
jgi:Holliday junction resolvase RusA-like endonuclease